MPDPIAPILEPYAALLTYLQTRTDLMTLVGQNYGEEFDFSNATAWPSLSWRNIDAGRNPNIDADGRHYHIDRVQFDLWGPNHNQLVVAAAMIDEAFDLLATQPGGVSPLDTTHYKFHYLRNSEGIWRELTWTDQQTASGDILRQRTADWMFSYKRRESVE